MKNILAAKPAPRRGGRPKTGTAWKPDTNGPWWIRITLSDGFRPAGWPVEGSEKWSEAKAKEYAAAETARAQREGRVRPVAGGLPGAASKPSTISTMLDRWLELVDAGRLAPATKAGHRTNATRIRDAFGAKTPADLTVPVLRAWVRSTRSEVSSSRCRNVFNTLGKFLDDAEAEGWHAAPNACRSPKVREELPAVGEREDEDKARHTEEEASKLLASVRLHSPERFVRYLLAFTTGMRAGELFGLRWSSLATEHGHPVLRVTSAVALIGDEGRDSRRAPKTRASRRPVPLHPVAVAVLASWKAEGWRALVGRDPKPEDPVLPGPGGEGWRPDAAPDFRADLRAAGLPDSYEGEPFEFRSTRRSFATWLDAHGVPGEIADRLIRHVDVSVRGKHYKGETPEGMARLATAVATIAIEIDSSAGFVQRPAIAYLARSDAHGDSLDTSAFAADSHAIEPHESTLKTAGRKRPRSSNLLSSSILTSDAPPVAGGLPDETPDDSIGGLLAADPGLAALFAHAHAELTGLALGGAL